MSNPLFSKETYTIDSIFRILASALALGVLLFILYYLRVVLFPFAIALLLAYILHPVIMWIEQYVRYRGIAIGVFIFGILVGLALIIGSLYPLIKTQTIEAGKALQLVFIENNIPTTLQAIVPESVLQSITTSLQTDNLALSLQEGNLSESMYKIGSLMLSSVGSLLNGVGSIFTVLGTIIAMCLYLFFILLDFGGSTSDLAGLIPKEYRKQVTGILNDFNNEMKAYFRGQLIVSLLGSAMFAICFTILGLPLAIPIGILVGLLGMIPYAQLFGMIPVGILAVIQASIGNESITMLLVWVIVIFAVIQLIQDMFLTPRIVGETTGLRPLFILLALSIWGQLLGLLGVIIAVPLTSLLLSIYRQFLQKQEQL